jgi:hypothetical protein
MADPQKPQRPKSAAQRASEANRLQQMAVRGNTPRPNDRRASDPTADGDQNTTPSNRKR